MTGNNQPNRPSSNAERHESANVADHLTTAQIESWNARRLPPAELLAADDHLTACAECRAKLRTAPVRVNEPTGVTHLTYDQLAAFASRDPLDIKAEAHLHQCAECRAEAEDLRAFGKGMQPARRR